MNYNYNYSEAELKEITEAAEQIGMPVENFQKYCVLLYTRRDKSKRNAYGQPTLPTLINDMETALSRLQPGQTFIVSSLFNPKTWTNLSESDKRSLAFKLKADIEVEEKPDFKLIGKKNGINLYQKN